MRDKVRGTTSDKGKTVDTREQILSRLDSPQAEVK